MRKIAISTISVISLAVITAIYSYSYEESIAAEPTSITIESKSLGINAKEEVQKVYDVRKVNLKEGLDSKTSKTTDKEELEALEYTFDSLDCMKDSMEHYPQLLEVINGDVKSAQVIYKEMEGNCVEDVLYYLKTNHPEKFIIAQKAFIEAGFVVPLISD